jgi:hypothetical protein
MRIRLIAGLLLSAAALILAGCGGGGGTTQANSSVSGVASKGLITNGSNNVKIYALNSDGTTGSLLKTTSTGANGEYSADLGSYRGAVLVEVSGTYTDEATGQPVTISANKPLRAALDAVNGSATVAVTPLTELAVQKAGSSLTSQNIKAANAEVSTLFNLDVVATTPVAPVAAALTGATAAQKNYTLALAAISQTANSNSPDAVYNVISAMKSDLDANNALTTTASQFTQALQDFAANDNNQTGVTASTIPASLLNVGAKTAVLTFAVAGITKGYGVDVTLDLPAGVTVVADATGSVSPSVIAAGDALLVAKYTAASGGTPGKVHIALVSSAGFGAGEVLTLTCGIAQGASATFDASLLEPGTKVADASGATIGGASLTLSAAN